MFFSRNHARGSKRARQRFGVLQPSGAFCRPTGLRNRRRTGALQDAASSIHPLVSLRRHAKSSTGVPASLFQPFTGALISLRQHRQVLIVHLLHLGAHGVELRLEFGGFGGAVVQRHNCMIGGKGGSIVRPRAVRFRIEVDVNSPGCSLTAAEVLLFLRWC